MADELQQWIAAARPHWREFRPELYRGLEATGTLDERLLKAAEQTQVELDSLVKAGMTHQNAWEMVREEYLFLPENPPKMTRRSAAERMRDQPHVSRDDLRNALTGQ
jgi:hypothetical protein